MGALDAERGQRRAWHHHPRSAFPSSLRAAEELSPADVRFARGQVVALVLAGAGNGGEEEIAPIFAIELIDGGVIQNGGGVEEVRAVVAARPAAQMAHAGRVA